MCGAGAATLDVLSDGTLLDRHGRPLVFHRRRLQESYASKHKLEIVLGTLLSFMFVKICEQAADQTRVLCCCVVLVPCESALRRDLVRV